MRQHLALIGTLPDAGVHQAKVAAVASEVAAIALLSAVASCIGAATLAWAWGWPLHGSSSLGAGGATAALVLMLAAQQAGRRVATAAGLVVVACITLSLLIAASVKDFSYDGQRYHQQAILELASGWNPLRGAPVEGSNALWINGYAKGPWTWSAAWLQATGSIELGKSLHLWLAGSAGLLAYGALQRWSAIPRWLAIWLALLAAANPVLLYQWPTHMNDSLLGSLLLALASQAVRLAASPTGLSSNVWGWLAAGLALALLPTVKSSGLAYGVLVCAVAGLLALQSRQAHLAKAAAGLAAVSLLPAVLLLGWNPYVTNTLRHGHPFYPLAGVNQVDIISGNSPEGLQSAGRVKKWLGSLLSESHSDLGNSNVPAFRLKWPGAVSSEELSRFSSKTDMRIGGFGPWFSLCLVLALTAAVAAMVAAAGRQGLFAAAALPVAILALTLVFPEPWWARYVPQMYLLPLAVAIAVLVSSSRQTSGSWARRLAFGSLAVLTVNNLAIAATFALGAVARELDSRTQLDSLAQISSADRPLAAKLAAEPALALRLSANGVHWRPAADSEPCSRWVALHQSTVQLCLPLDAEPVYRDSSPLVEQLKSGLTRRPMKSPPP